MLPTGAVEAVRAHAAIKPANGVSAMKPRTAVPNSFVNEAAAAVDRRPSYYTHGRVFSHQAEGDERPPPARCPRRDLHCSASALGNPLAENRAGRSLRAPDVAIQCRHLWIKRTATPFPLPRTKTGQRATRPEAPMLCSRWYGLQHVWLCLINKLLHASGSNDLRTC